LEPGYIRQAELVDRRLAGAQCLSVER
jgi:hypothetical protein